MCVLGRHNVVVLGLFEDPYVLVFRITWHKLFVVVVRICTMPSLALLL